MRLIPTFAAVSSLSIVLSQAIAAPLFVAANGPGSVELTPRKTDYTVGENVHLKAIPDHFAGFSSWSDGIQNAERDITIAAADNNQLGSPIYIPLPNHYLATFTNTTLVEDQIWLADEAQVPIPIGITYSYVLQIGSDALLSSYGYFNNPTNLSLQITRLSLSGQTVWAHTFDAVPFVWFVVQPNENIWVPQAEDGYGFTTYNGAGVELGKRSYGIGRVSRIFFGHPGETLLSGGAANVVLDENANADPNRQVRASYPTLIPAQNGGYFNFGLEQGSGTGYLGSMLRSLDFFFNSRSQTFLPDTQILSAVSLTDQKVAAVLQNRSKGGSSLSLISPDGTVQALMPVFSYIFGPALVAGEQGDFWVMRNTALQPGVQGAVNPRLTHFGSAGEILSELPLDYWDPESVRFTPSTQRPGWIRATGLTRDNVPGAPNPRAAVFMEFTSRRVLPGTPRIFVNGLRRLNYSSTNEVSAQVTVTTSLPGKLYISLNGSTNLTDAQPFTSPFPLTHDAIVHAFTTKSDGAVLVSEAVEVHLERRAELRAALSLTGKPALQYFSSTDSIVRLETATDLDPWEALTLPAPINGVSQLEFDRSEKWRFFRILPGGQP